MLAAGQGWGREGGWHGAAAEAHREVDARARHPRLQQLHQLLHSLACGPHGNADCSAQEQQRPGSAPSHAARSLAWPQVRAAASIAHGRKLPVCPSSLPGTVARGLGVCKLILAFVMRSAGPRRLGVGTERPGQAVGLLTLGLCHAVLCRKSVKDLREVVRLEEVAFRPSDMPLHHF
jgi:hypothetical protein